MSVSLSPHQWELWAQEAHVLKTTYGPMIFTALLGSYFLELRNHFFAFFGVKILKFFDEDPGWGQFGSGMEKSRIRDVYPGKGGGGEGGARKTSNFFVPQMALA
jgi:hypothetical protein